MKCMKCPSLAMLITAAILISLTCMCPSASVAADYQFDADQIWLIRGKNTVVQKIDVKKAQESAMRIRGPRGGEIMFCGPGGCNPQQQAPPAQEPPKFDMPGNEPPKLDLPAADNSSADISLATIAAAAAGALGAFAGYKQQMNDPDLVEEAVKSEKSTTPALEVVK